MGGRGLVPALIAFFLLFVFLDFCLLSSVCSCCCFISILPFSPSPPPPPPSSIGCGEMDAGGGGVQGDHLELSTFPLVVLLPVFPSFFFLCVDVILLLLSH